MFSLIALFVSYRRQKAAIVAPVAAAKVSAPAVDNHHIALPLAA
ncbi:hypothetical protein ACG3SL_00800 [Sphingomonas sp. CJ20]